MKIEHNKEDKLFILLDDDGKEIGHLEYMQSRRGIIFARKTVVNEEHRGRGLGKPLVDALSGYARENGYKIRAICEFTKKMFEKFPEEYCDVIFDSDNCGDIDADEAE